MSDYTYAPENWCLIRINLPEETIYKVFGEWRGGYLHGDSWRLNSGVVKVEQDDDYYYYYGESGSCYKCSKNNYGIRSSYNLSVLSGMIEDTKKKFNTTIDILENPREYYLDEMVRINQELGLYDD